MTTSEEWGHLTNARFSRSLLTWDPEEGRLVGQLVATGPISRYQYWMITRIDSGWEVTVQNLESKLFVQVKDGKLTCGDEPTTFYSIEKDGLVSFQVPNGPTWDLLTDEPGAEVVLVLNGGDLTDGQKWKQ